MATGRKHHDDDLDAPSRKVERSAFSYYQPSDGEHGGHERCENCHYFGGEHCRLFAMINRELPDTFDLRTSITPNAWCGAFTADEAEDGSDDDDDGGDEAKPFAHGGRVHYERPLYSGSMTGAYKLPLSAVRALGHGDRRAGEAVPRSMFGEHAALGPGVVHPNAIQQIGNGDAHLGRAILQQFVKRLMQ